MVLTPPLGGVFIWGKYGRTSINLILDSVGGRMGRITSFIKQVIVFFLVTALIIRPTFAANVGGWTLGNPIAQGASAVVNATKTVVINGANVIKNSTAKITPPASSVAKVLARGAAGYALSVAVEQLLGSVDWVLDPANNRIKYYEPNPQNLEKGWGPVNDTLYPTLQSACEAYMAPYMQTGYYFEVKETNGSCALYDASGRYKRGTTLGYVNNPAYDPNAEKEEKYIPLPTVAQKVISNAENGDTQAQVATVAAAQDIINEAETDQTKARPIVNQLEANSQTQTDESATAQAKPQADPITGEQAPPTDITLEFPVFCSWAPTICEAAQVVISFPNTLTGWYNETKTKFEDWALSISEAWAKVKEEYYQQPEENTETELEIPDLEQDIQIDTDINFGGSCPSPLSTSVNFMGISQTIEFSFDPVCQIAQFIKPVVISISAFSAALIVAGIRTEDD